MNFLNFTSFELWITFISLLGFFYLCSHIYFLIILFLHLQKKNNYKNMRETHGREIEPLPDISIITSLKGPTPFMSQGLNSLLNQDYPGNLELVIAIKDQSEPLYEEALQVLANNEKFKSGKIKVTWILEVKLKGLNPRTEKIAQAFAKASHSWIFMTCIDTRFEPDFLRTSMQCSSLNSDCYVSSFPVIDSPHSFGAKLEAIGLNFDVTQFFLFSTLVKKPSAAYGGAFLFHRELLLKSGGFNPILPLLTDDITLARDFTKAGGKFILAPGLSYVHQPDHNFKSFWTRQVRWRMIGRYFLPEWFFMAPLGWSGFYFLITGLVSNSFNLMFSGVAIFVFRMICSAILQKMISPNKKDFKHSWIMPIYDFLAIGASLTALRKKSIRWGDQILEIDCQGSVKGTTIIENEIL